MLNIQLPDGKVLQFQEKKIIPVTSKSKNIKPRIHKFKKKHCCLFHKCTTITKVAVIITTESFTLFCQSGVA